MGVLPGIGGLLGTARRKRTADYRSSLTSITGGVTWTFAAMDIGAAAADRCVVVSISATGGTSAAVAVTAVTIGGIAAAPIISRENGTSGFLTEALWIARVPTGITADVVVTFASTKARLGMGVWAVYGLDEVAAYDADAVYEPPGVASLSLDTLDDGVVIAASGVNETYSHTWGGVTERFDATFGSQVAHSGADAATVDGTLTLTCTYSGTGTRRIVVAASF